MAESEQQVHTDKVIDEVINIEVTNSDSTELNIKDFDKNYEKKKTIPSAVVSVADVNATEPMLKTDINRYTIPENKRQDLWEAYKNHEKMIWNAEELDYSSDKKDWESLNEDEQFFIKHILAFFSSSDGIVTENINMNFASEVQWPEARAFYALQSYIEQVHSQVYSNLISAYVKDQAEKDKLFKAIETMPCIRRKADWVRKWMNTEEHTFAERLIAFAVMEGVFFSGSFCSIFWLKSRQKMISCLGKSNEWISRDEGLHCNFAVLEYEYLENKLTKERIHEIFKEAVDIECQFITEAIPCKLIGMNSTMMIRYVKYIANFWMTKLTTSKGRKCPELYKVTNPFQFMNILSIDGKTDFFNQRVTEYQNASNMPNKDSDTFSKLDDDF